jgi:GxxExxY protein
LKITQPFSITFEKKMNENRISREVIGCAIKVHSILGPGLLENVYKECLAQECMASGLVVKREVGVPVIYHDIRMDCGYRLDLLIENKLVIEVKSVERLLDLHKAQVLTYLRLGDYRLGLLLNFNVLRLKDGCVRLINGQIME